MNGQFSTQTNSTTNGGSNSLLLVLDLDETLLHSSDFRLERKEDYFYYEIDKFGEVEFFVYKRPYWNLIQRVIENNPNLEYGFYSNSLANYCHELSSWLCTGMTKRPIFTFDRSRVTNTLSMGNGIYGGNGVVTIKDLKKVKRATGFNIQNMIALDDKCVFPRQYGNLIRVNEFNGNDDDTTLGSLSFDLDELVKNYQGGDIRQQIQTRIYED